MLWEGLVYRALPSVLNSRFLTLSGLAIMNLLQFFEMSFFFLISWSSCMLSFCLQCTLYPFHSSLGSHFKCNFFLEDLSSLPRLCEAPFSLFQALITLYIFSRVGTIYSLLYPQCLAQFLAQK